MTNSQARVRRNEWGTIPVPDIGDWQPRRSVSVVMPTFRGEFTLPFTLAGLAAQTYPAHLIEVLVIDDGADPPIQLPEVRPENTRVVRVESGWGRANACHIGALAADGEIIHWLDADMMSEPEQIEAQLRWHHALDYAVVLGQKWFVDPSTLVGVDPAVVRDTIAAGNIADLFIGQQRDDHWGERWYKRFDDLRTIGPRALRLNIGCTASLTKELYFDSGGMEADLRLGEDIALGYRLGEAGGVFVAERESKCWHLGRSNVMKRRNEVNDHNDAYLSDRLPELRAKRRAGRLYSVPYLEVVLDTEGLDYHSVIATVDAVLNSTMPDLQVTLIGPWDQLSDQRWPPLDDPQLNTRLIQQSYRGDPRVHLVDELPSTRCPGMFRLTLPSADWAPTHKTVARLVDNLERSHHGLRLINMPDGQVARVERTAALSRARRVIKSGEFLDDVLDELFGAHTFEGVEVGFVAYTDVVRPRLKGTAGEAEDPVAAWDYVDEPKPARVTKPAAPPAEDPAPVRRNKLAAWFRREA